MYGLAKVASEEEKKSGGAGLAALGGAAVGGIGGGMALGKKMGNDSKERMKDVAYQSGEFRVNNEFDSKQRSLQSSLDDKSQEIKRQLQGIMQKQHRGDADFYHNKKELERLQGMGTNDIVGSAINDPRFQERMSLERMRDGALFHGGGIDGIPAANKYLDHNEALAEDKVRARALESHRNKLTSVEEALTRTRSLLDGYENEADDVLDLSRNHRELSANQLAALNAERQSALQGITNSPGYQNDLRRAYLVGSERGHILGGVGGTLLGAGLGAGAYGVSRLFGNRGKEQ